MLVAFGSESCSKSFGRALACVVIVPKFTPTTVRLKVGVVYRVQPSGVHAHTLGIPETHFEMPRPRVHSCCACFAFVFSMICMVIMVPGDYFEFSISRSSVATSLTPTPKAKPILPKPPTPKYTYPSSGGTVDNKYITRRPSNIANARFNGPPPGVQPKGRPSGTRFPREPARNPDELKLEQAELSPRIKNTAYQIASKYHAESDNDTRVISRYPPQSLPSSELKPLDDELSALKRPAVEKLVAELEDHQLRARNTNPQMACQNGELDDKGEKLPGAALLYELKREGVGDRKAPSMQVCSVKLVPYVKIVPFSHLFRCLSVTP